MHDDSIMLTGDAAAAYRSLLGAVRADLAAEDASVHLMLSDVHDLGEVNAEMASLVALLTYVRLAEDATATSAEDVVWDLLAQVGALAGAGTAITDRLARHATPVLAHVLGMLDGTAPGPAEQILTHRHWQALGLDGVTRLAGMLAVRTAAGYRTSPETLASEVCLAAAEHT